MGDKPIINIVATQCRPEDEEKFNKWYDEVHVPMLLKFRGLREVIRCKIINETEGLTNYLALYQFESQKAFAEYESSPELAAATAERKETWGEEGFSRKWRAQYEIVKTWER